MRRIYLGMVLQKERKIGFMEDNEDKFIQSTLESYVQTKGIETQHEIRNKAILISLLLYRSCEKIFRIVNIKLRIY